jgi:hypothetical protein
MKWRMTNQAFDHSILIAARNLQDHFAWPLSDASDLPELSALGTLALSTPNGALIGRESRDVMQATHVHFQKYQTAKSKPSV